MLFLRVFDWPKDGELSVPGLWSKVKRAYLLADADRSPLEAREAREGTVIVVGEQAPDANVSVVALELEDGLIVTAPIVTPAADGSIQFLPTDASIQGSARIENHSGVDNIGWWSDPASFVTWFCKVAEPGDFAAEITSSCLGKAAVMTS